MAFVTEQTTQLQVQQLQPNAQQFESQIHLQTIVDQPGPQLQQLNASQTDPQLQLNILQPDPQLQQQYNTRLKASEMMRRAVEAQTKSHNTARILLDVIHKEGREIAKRFSDGEMPREILEIDLVDLWYRYFVAARYLEHNGAHHHRLLVQLLQHEAQHAAPPDAILHNEAERPSFAYLPWFTEFMVDHWKMESARMGPSQRQNLSLFLAKAASLHVNHGRLPRLGLLVLKETLEMERPLGADRTATQPLHTVGSELTVADLLPCAIAWLSEAGYVILDATQMGWTSNSEVNGLGPLCPKQHSDFGEGGYSPRRWFFWLKRLGDIHDEADQKGYLQIKLLAREAIYHMLLAARATPCRVRTVINRYGGFEAFQRERLGRRQIQ